MAEHCHYLSGSSCLLRPGRDGRVRCLFPVVSTPASAGGTQRPGSRVYAGLECSVQYYDLHIPVPVRQMVFQEDPLATPNHKTAESANATADYWRSFMPSELSHRPAIRQGGRRLTRGHNLTQSAAALSTSTTTPSTTSHPPWNTATAREPTPSPSSTSCIVSFVPLPQASGPLRF